MKDIKHLGSQALSRRGDNHALEPNAFLRSRHLSRSKNGRESVKECMKKALVGAETMDRLIQLTRDLEEIVNMMRGRKPERPSFDVEELIQNLDRQDPPTLQDAYRSIYLTGLMQGRFALLAYSIGKKMAHGFSPKDAYDFTEVLASFGISGFSHRRTPQKKIQYKLSGSVSCRGLEGAQKSVCFLEAGLLAGLLEQLTGKKTELQEIKCRAKGNAACEFGLLKPKRLDKNTDPYTAALLSGGYTEENLKLFTTLASHALTAIDNALLLEKTWHESVIDGLTEIYNHRYFQEMIRVELKRSSRHRIPVALVMMDIDHFKSFNDRYGHPQGDDLLKRTAAFLKNSVRDIDIVARYGGDEFAIILPQTDGRGAIRVVERMQKSAFVERCRRQYSSVKLNFTFGVNLAPGQKGIDPRKFIGETDRALLQAKSKRNGQLGITRRMANILKSIDS